MARNELTKDAIRIVDEIRHRAGNTKDNHAAEHIGVDASTLCRFKADHLDKFCAYLDYLGLTVVDKELKVIHKAELEALVLLAGKGVENFLQ